MLAVIITILKITGIVLLSILALVLLIVCLILFVPIRYRIDAAKPSPEDDITAAAKVTYLLHIISGGASYDKEFDKYARLFGIKIWPRHKKTDEAVTTGETSQSSEPSYDSATIADNDPTLEYHNEEADHKPVNEEDYSIDWNTDDESAASLEDDVDDDEDIFDIIDRIIGTVSDKYGDITGKYETIRKEIRFWDKMANDTRNRNAVALIKDLVLKLLKKIAPRKVKGLVHFGFDDPATTGKILMYLALIYPVLPRKLKVEPDFEDALVYGNCLIKGKITLFFPVVYFIRIYFNRDFKRMWRIYKKHSNS